MNIVLLFYTTILSITVILALILIRYAYQRRHMPGATYFIYLLCASVIYNATYIGELNATNFETAYFWYQMEHLAIPIQLYFWFIMCMDFVGISSKRLKVLKYCMLYHPILYYTVFYTNHLHHCYIRNFSFVSNGHFHVIITEKGSLYLLTVLSGSVMATISTILFIRAYLIASKYQRNGYLIMLSASILPWLSVYLLALNKNFLGIDYFPVFTIISGTVYLIGIFQYRMFHTIPIATEIVFRQSKDGILLVDMSDRIIDINYEMLQLYPDLKESPKRNTFTQFVNKHPEFEKLRMGDEMTEFHMQGGDEIKHYQAVLQPIIIENGLNIGKIILVNDITQFYVTQKALEMIASIAEEKAETNEISFLQAQISPHFINNTLSVIASMITRAPEQAKGLISDLGEYLSNCYYFDPETTMVPLSKELEAVLTYVNIEKARFMERLDFEIISDEIPYIRIPRLILQPLVENAIRHGVLQKMQGGRVEVNIYSVDNMVCFDIIDDGVGMNEETVSSILNSKSENRSIGISNIHKRLVKIYHQGLTIKSELGKGTKVSFCITRDKEHM